MSDTADNSATISTSYELVSTILWIETCRLSHPEIKNRILHLPVEFLFQLYEVALQYGSLLTRILLQSVLTEKATQQTSHISDLMFIYKRACSLPDPSLSSEIQASIRLCQKKEIARTLAQIHPDYAIFKDLMKEDPFEQDFVALAEAGSKGCPSWRWWCIHNRHLILPSGTPLGKFIIQTAKDEVAYEDEDEARIVREEKAKREQAKTAEDGSGLFTVPTPAQGQITMTAQIRELKYESSNVDKDAADQVGSFQSEASPKRHPRRKLNWKEVALLSLTSPRKRNWKEIALVSLIRSNKKYGYSAGKKFLDALAS